MIWLEIVTPINNNRLCWREEKKKPDSIRNRKEINQAKHFVVNQVCVVMSHQAKWFRSQSTSLCNIKESTLNECTRQRTSTKRTVDIALWKRPLHVHLLYPSTKYFSIKFGHAPARSLQTVWQRFYLQQARVTNHELNATQIICYRSIDLEII